METIDVPIGSKKTIELITLHKGTVLRRDSRWFHLVRLKCQELWVELTSLPDSLKVYDKSKLILLRHHNEEPSSGLKDFTVKNEGYPYEVLLDPNQIKDYTDNEGDEAIIRFKISVKRHRKIWRKKIDFKKIFELKLKLQKAKPDIDVFLELETDFVEGGFGHCHRKVLLGEVRVENKTSVAYSDPVNCEVEITFDDPQSPSPYPIHGIIDFQEDVFEIDESDNVLASANIAANRKLLPPLIPGGKTEQQVYVDIGKISNPETQAVYLATVNIDYFDFVNKQHVRKTTTKEFLITQDRKTTALMARIEAQGKSEVCDKKRNKNFPIHSNFL